MRPTWAAAFAIALLAPACVAAPIYLHCPMETGGLLSFILDREAATLSRAFPGQEPSRPENLMVTDTEFVLQTVYQDVLLEKIAINRYTLRVLFYGAMTHTAIAGQCSVIDRQL